MIVKRKTRRDTEIKRMPGSTGIIAKKNRLDIQINFKINLSYKILSRKHKFFL